jgi:hypothetical protein
MVQSFETKGKPVFKRLKTFFIVFLFAGLLLTRSSVPPGDQTRQVRAFTRTIEFDYAGWMLDALRLKLNQIALGSADYLSNDARKQVVLNYLQLVNEIQIAEAKISLIFSDPNVPDPQQASAGLREQLATLRDRRTREEPVAEAILQSQVADVVGEMGLGWIGQPVPPVMFHSTPLPLALIVSPRNVIRQDEDISLVPDLSVDQFPILEEKVDKALNVSSLVVNVGGVGVYPTMVYQTSDADGLLEVVSHEWVHNFLTLRPLGASYLNTPELRIINETTASIAGKEIGRIVLERYYPELVPPPPAPPAQTQAQQPGPQQPAFDYYEEMHITRVNADQLLADGKIDEAEAYMEARRKVFWDHGYRFLRKINQAYFAFYGAYADQPGGAAGEDPVGAAVRALRAQSLNLTDFLQRISWISSYGQLQKMVK